MTPNLESSLRVVFWNVKRKDLSTLVCEIAKSTIADVIVLLENLSPSEYTLGKLQQQISSDFYFPACSPTGRFHCFSRKSALDLSEVFSGNRISVRRLIFQSHTILLSLVHGVDIQNYDTEERQSAAQLLVDEFKFVKEIQKTDQLIAMGDFNMNPFDRGMNLAAGFNAMMTKTCVKPRTREYLGKHFDLYYNPMWSYLGDLSEGPPGTIYNRSRRGLYGWSMLDQVIVSHSVLHLFGKVSIISKAGTISLLDSNDRPDAKIASDHLPIMLELKEPVNV